MSKTYLPVAKLALSFAITCAIPTAFALPTRIAQSQDEALSLLNAASGGALTSRTNAIDAYATVHALPGAVLLADNTAAAPLARAQNFLASYGAVAGVTGSYDG